MSQAEADNLRKSGRIVMKETSTIETIKLSDSDLKKERLKVKCSVIGCTFVTEYLPPSLADHWKSIHRAQFGREEIERQIANEEELRFKRFEV